MDATVAQIKAALAEGIVIPFLGAGALTAGSNVPAASEPLAAMLTSRVSVPHRIRNNLTAAAQFIENFKHRKTLVKHMIDIQTPIPPVVQARRKGRHFLFLGMRFDTQIDRTYARQVMKRSCEKHWAVLPREPTRTEARFLAQQNIERIDCSLEAFATMFRSVDTAAA